MRAIGGYFELELSGDFSYHSDAIALNTGRNAFEYILLSYKFDKIYIPYYTCDVLLEPLVKHKINFEFYSVNENFEPEFLFSKIQENEGFLYTNYFGLKDVFISHLVKRCKNLIIDNCQSFFSKPMENISTFYSARKFFGVPDGSYLYCEKSLRQELPRDISSGRFNHLTERIDLSAEEGYDSFKENEKKLDHQPLRSMSRLTKLLLANIDYKKMGNIRQANFNYFDAELNKSNKLSFDLCLSSTPMVYPFWTEDRTLKQRLLQNKIYTATYWPNVLDWAPKGSLERIMVKEIIHLPIDHRYNIEEINKILRIII